MTEFQPTNNPNVTPSGYPIKFWGLLGKVAPIVYTKQQIFLIGSCQTENKSFWLRHFCQYLNQHPLSPNKI